MRLLLLEKLVLPSSSLSSTSSSSSSLPKLLLLLLCNLEIRPELFLQGAIGTLALTLQSGGTKRDPRMQQR